MPLPPGPSERFFGLSFYRKVRRDRLGALRELAQAYGDVSTFKVGVQRLVLLNHPNFVEDVLVTRARLFKKGRALERARRLLGDGLLTSEGDLHRRQRRLVQPAFHKPRIAGYADTMVRHAARAAERWQEGQSIDVTAEMNRLTLTIVGETLLGTNVEEDAGGVRDALTAVLSAFPLTMSPFAPILERLPLPAVRRYDRARIALDRLVYRIIQDRRARPDDRGDLLSMLLLANDAEEGGERMTDRQVRDEAMTIFLAGHETTANALAWTWHLLAAHPDVERRLHEEIDRVLDSRTATADDAPGLVYTRMVIAESMRRYPPAWGIGRRAIEDVTIGGYLVPKGTVVLVSQFLLHHDPRFFTDPERFDPDRWLPERQALRPRLAYFPFGAGTRVCIGEPFAWIEGILVLATIAQRWRLERIGTDPIPMQPGITLRPASRIRLVPRRRSSTMDSR